MALRGDLAAGVRACRAHGHVHLMYCVSFFVVGLTVGSLGPSVPHLALLQGVHADGLWYAFTVRALGSAVSYWVGGKLCDRHPSRKHRFMGGRYTIWLHLHESDRRFILRFILPHNLVNLPNLPSRAAAPPPSPPRAP